MSSLINILLLSFLGSIVGLVGGVIFLKVKSLSTTLTKYSTPFAAGVMMTVAFLGLLPGAAHLIGETSFTVVLLTIVGAYLFETWMCDLHHHDHSDAKNGQNHGANHSSVPLVVVGDTIHNFIDGVAIAAAYLTNPGLGLVTAISTLLHEIPHEIGDFGILLKAGFSRKKVFWVNFVSSLSTFLGALMVYFWVADSQLPGYLLAIAAGMFIYLGVSDFLPKAHQSLEKSKAVAVLLLGMVIMYLTMTLIPHTH